MIAGHYATALVAHQKFPKGPLLFFLVVSQFQDLVWFVFHYLGLEPTTPQRRLRCDNRHDDCLDDVQSPPLAAIFLGSGDLPDWKVVVQKHDGRVGRNGAVRRAHCFGFLFGPRP